MSLVQSGILHFAWRRAHREPSQISASIDLPLDHRQQPRHGWELALTRASVTVDRENLNIIP
jgi:hypothetical protein